MRKGGGSGGGGNGGGPSEGTNWGGQPTAQGSSNTEQAAVPTERTTGPQAAAAATPVPPYNGEGNDSGPEQDDSEDEMASIVGADDLDRREGESAPQHRLRLAKHLKERAARKKEERIREGKNGKNKGDGKERQAARGKPVQKTK